MNEKDDFLEYPTISELTEKDKEQYRINHVDVKGLLKRINVLEQQKKIIAVILVITIGLGVWIVNPFKSNVSESNIHESDASRPDMDEPDTSTDSEIQNDNKINVSIGDIIEFGNYEGEAIEWQVLDINEEENSALLVSKYVLFEKEFNAVSKGCTWETSTIRDYLNNVFYKYYFFEEEREVIKEVVVKNQDNEESGKKSGNNTADKIFLLNNNEVQTYFEASEERVASLRNGEKYVYWLRSSGFRTDNAVCVLSNGLVDERGRNVDNGSIGVRPALWMNL